MTSATADSPTGAWGRRPARGLPANAFHDGPVQQARCGERIREVARAGRCLPLAAARVPNPASYALGQAVRPPDLPHGGFSVDGTASAFLRRFFEPRPMAEAGSGAEGEQQWGQGTHCSEAPAEF